MDRCNNLVKKWRNTYCLEKLMWMSWMLLVINAVSFFRIRVMKSTYMYISTNFFKPFSFGKNLTAIGVCKYGFIEDFERIFIWIGYFYLSTSITADVWFHLSSSVNICPFVKWDCQEIIYIYTKKKTPTRVKNQYGENTPVCELKDRLNLPIMSHFQSLISFVRSQKIWLAYFLK